MNFREIKDQVAQWESHGGEQDSSVEGALNTLINQIYLELCGERDWLFTRMRMTVPLLQEVISLPVDVLRIVNAWDAAGRPLERRELIHQTDHAYENQFGQVGIQTYSLESNVPLAVYSTGTIDITQGTNTATGTAFTTDLIGRVLKADSDNEWYWIIAVPDATTLTLHTNRTGADLVGATFVVDPQGVFRLKFAPVVSGGNAEFLVSRRPTKLTQDTDIPILPEPFHGYLAWQARWSRLVNDEERNYLFRAAEKKSAQIYDRLLKDQAISMQGMKRPRIG